jgi:hypothetical protein
MASRRGHPSWVPARAAARAPAGGHKGRPYKHKNSFSRRACARALFDSFAPHRKNRGERSAERRNSSWSAPHRKASPPADARGAEARQKSGRARLPALHCGTSPIARLISGPRFLELPGANGRTLPGASAASTSRTSPCTTRKPAKTASGGVPPHRSIGPWSSRLGRLFGSGAPARSHSTPAAAGNRRPAGQGYPAVTARASLAIEPHS